ncbi:hypothetical protein M9H77_00318 [Catharanthus roseus]|nr:hypothetical protein M9H77_00318 [Catharanthus roseus]
MMPNRAIPEVEDQAAKISAEEQMHLTTIQNLEKDLDFVKNEAKRLIEVTDRIMKEKGHICSRILENQRKVVSLESDSSTLSQIPAFDVQTLDLIQNERVTLSAKLVEKRTYYSSVVYEITSQLKEQKEWVIADKHTSCIGEKSLVIFIATQLEDKIGTKTDQIEVSQGKRMKSLTMNLDASTTDFDRMTHLKADLVSKNITLKQSLKLAKDKLNNFKPELKEMESKMLEEELQALLSDKAGETEYLQSLQLQIINMKEISHTVKCSCGEEYKVELGRCA